MVPGGFRFKWLLGVTAALNASGTSVAYRLASDVIPEGHLCRRGVWVHQVGFDEEAMILVDDVKIQRNGRVGAKEGCAGGIGNTARETTVGGRRSEIADEAVIQRVGVTRVNQCAIGGTGQQSGGGVRSHHSGAIVFTAVLLRETKSIIAAER